MKQKRKITGRKLLGFLLALVLVLIPGISITAYAENSENAPTLGNSDLSGTGWSWDADTNKLTIGGVNWSGTLVMPAGSTLVLADGTRNTITGSGTTEVYYGSSKIGNIYTGLYGKGALTISGSGELYVYSDSEKETSRSERQRGICVNGNLTIKDDVGTVYAEAENSSFASGNASNYCDIYSATVGISVHGNYIQHGGNVECVAGKGGYQSIGIVAGRGAAGITVDGANAVLTGRGGYASNHSFGMCCGSEFDDTQCSINIQKGKVNLYAADCGRFSYGLFGGNGCILNVSGGEITAIGKEPANGSRGLRSRGGINISGGVLYVEGLTSALYAGGGGISGNISITDGMLVAKTGSETAVQVDNGKITLDTGLTTDNVKSGFTSGSSSKIDVDDKSKPVRIGNLRYYVQFDVQNHGVSPETQYFSMGGNQKVSKPEDPVAAGYEFGGWFEEAGCTTEWDFENEVTNDKTLYAKWTEIPATAPTISAQPEDLSMTYGYTGGSICVEAMAAKDTTYKDLTYQWYSNTTASNEGGTAITENGTSATYTIPTGKAVGTKEYYYCVVTATRVDNSRMATVISNVASVTVSAEGNLLTYDGNGNTSGNVPTDIHSPYANGATVTVLGNTGSLKKTGYTFVGWNTKADGTGTDYAEGATFAISANTTLYAKWNNPVDKTDLNNAIKEAKEYYDTIKGNTDYSEAADKLDKAIKAAEEVAKSDKVTKADVSAAAEAVTKAKATAENAAFDAEKEAQKKAADALAAEGDSDASKKLIEDAKKAIDALAYDETKSLDENKKAVAAILTKLKDDLTTQRAADKKEADDTEVAKKVTDAINALPASDKVATTDKAAIEAARKAYDALTADQKKKVPADVLKKLTDAENALKAAEKDAADKNVVDAINKLPVSSKVTTANKAAIEAARKAYDALTADQKKNVPADVLKKLTDDEKALAAAEATDKAAKELEAAKKEAQAAMNEQVTVTQKGNKFTVKWKKASSADGYYVYAQYCGKKIKKPVKTIKKNTTTKVTIKKINGKKLNLKKQFKLYVVPYKIINGKKVKLAKSMVDHVVGSKSTKYSNVKKLTLKKKKYTVNVGKTVKIKAKITLVNKNKKHISKGHGAKFRYKSSDTGIATVDKNGKIKGIKKGTCTIYVYSINGLTKKAQITVK